MKQFFTKYFGLFGVALYYIFAVILRIPVALFLFIIMAGLIIAMPITKRNYCWNWSDKLIDWYQDI